MSSESKITELFKLHHADARDLNSIMKEKVVSATITSPPYYNMKDYGYKNQIGYGQEYDDYLKDIGQVFDQIYKLPKDDGSLWVIIDTFKKNNEVVTLPFDFSKKLNEVGWKLRDIIIWDKNKTVPWSKKGQTKNKFEYILLFSKFKDFNYNWTFAKINNNIS